MRPIRGSWLGLFLTLVAVLGMLPHAMAPASAHAHPTPRADQMGVNQALLRLFGATLCGREGGNAPEKSPHGHPVASDHCPLCVTDAHVPLLVLTVALGVPLPSVVEGRRSMGGRSPGRPLALPRLAHTPRAPPIA